MGTSSMIGFYNEDGTVTATYCHYDGYVSYNGRLLFDSYNTPELAKAVANVGYLSGLKSDLYESVVEALHTDKPVTYKSVKDYLDTGANFCGAEYLYLHDGMDWYFTDMDVKSFEEVEMNLQ